MSVTLPRGSACALRLAVLVYPHVLLLILCVCCFRLHCVVLRSQLIHGVYVELGYPSFGMLRQRLVLRRGRHLNIPQTLMLLLLFTLTLFLLTQVFRFSSLSNLIQDRVDVKRLIEIVNSALAKIDVHLMRSLYVHRGRTQRGWRSGFVDGSQRIM